MKQQFSIFKTSIILHIFLTFGFILSNAQNPSYAVKPVLTGMMTSSTNSEKWFKDIANWGVTGWECFALHYRAQLFNNKFT